MQAWWPICRLNSSHLWSYHTKPGKVESQTNNTITMVTLNLVHVRIPYKVISAPRIQYASCRANGRSRRSVVDQHGRYREVLR